MSLALALVLGVEFSRAATAQNSGEPGGNACNVRNTLAQVDALLKQHQTDDARLLLQKAAACEHLSQVERFNIGWIYGKMHDFNTALKIFATVNSDVPDLQTHAYAVALGHFELGDYPAAIGTLQAVQEKHALSPDCANLLGVSYAKLGQYQDAYAVLRKQLQQHPHELFSYLNLITLLTDAGQFAEAQKIATGAVAAFPHNPEVLIVRGAAETLLGQLQQARRDFSGAVAIAPANPESRFFLALTNYKLTDYSVAAGELRSAMQGGVVSSDLEYLLAECMLKLEPTQAEEAIAELNKAIRLDANSVPARTLRGKLLLEEGNPQKAAADLEIAHKIDPGMRSAAYNLARAWFALGKRDEAQALYRQLQTQTTDTVTELSDRRIREVLSGGP